MKINYDIDQVMFRTNKTLDDLIAIRNINFKHEPEISVVETVFERQVFIAEPKQVFDDIRDGTYADIIKQIRQTDDPEERRELKKQLPAILF